MQPYTNDTAATLSNIKVKKDLYNCYKDVSKYYDLKMSKHTKYRWLLATHL